MIQDSFQTKPLRDLSSKGLFWGPEGAIAVGEARFHELLRKNAPAAYCGISSVYYNASENATFHAQGTSGFVWWWTSRRCMRKALRRSNQLESECSLSTMTTEQLLSRGTILKKKGKYAKALKCFEIGAEKAKLDRHVHQPIHALLLVGLADLSVHVRTQRSAMDIMNLLVKAAELIQGWKTRDNAQASRVFYGAVAVLESMGRKGKVTELYRQAAEIFAKRSEADEYLLRHGLLL